MDLVQHRVEWARYQDRERKKEEEERERERGLKLVDNFNLLYDF